MVMLTDIFLYDHINQISINLDAARAVTIAESDFTGKQNLVKDGPVF